MGSKRVVRVLAALQVAALCLGAAVCPAYAGAMESIGGTVEEDSSGVVTVPFRKGTGKARYFYGRYGTPKEKYAMRNIKTSNARVVTAEYDFDPSDAKYRLQLRPQGYGTARVSFTYRGKKHRIKVRVVKATCPVKSITSGSKTLKGSKLYYRYGNWTHEAGYVDYRKAFVRQGKRFRVTPAKGWKLEFVHRSLIGQRRIRNGSKLPSDIYVVYALLYQQETGVHQRVALTVGPAR